MKKINLGCGPQIVEEWINVDYSYGAKMAKIPFFALVNRVFGIFSMTWDKRIFLHDLRKPFPWGDATIDVVYSSHTLEHLSREDGQRFLSECSRILKPGGIIRILVPDLAVTVAHYLDGRTPADRFVEGLGVLYTPGKSFLKRLLAPLVEYPHKCHYDTSTLVAILDGLGFDAAHQNAFDSRIADIREIELHDRTENAVVVEGVKRPHHVRQVQETGAMAAG